MRRVEGRAERTSVVEFPPETPDRLEISLSTKRGRGRILFAGGLLGVFGVALILATPELSIPAALGGALVASIGSAAITMIARR